MKKIRKVKETTLVAAQVINGYSDSENDGYACSYINDLIEDSYSLNEVKTNKTWISGEPIYRKVIDFGTLPNSSEKAVASGITNLDKIISMRGFAKNMTEGTTIVIPNISTAGAQYYVDIFFTTNSDVRIRTASNRTPYYAYVILEYTKTIN